MDLRKDAHKDELLQFKKVECAWFFLEDLLKSFKEAVLTEHLIKNCTTNCLKFLQETMQPQNDNSCIFCAVALHYQGTHSSQDKPQIVQIIHQWKGWTEPSLVLRTPKQKFGCY